MTAKSPKLKDIVLIAVEGDVDPGAEFLITPDDPVPIGRSAKGITLLDPMVSIQHAVVHFDLARGYVIQDLNSATGTWIDEECIKGESRPIGVGTVLRFGDTVFQVGRPARLLPWMRVILVAALAVALVSGVVLFVLPFFRDSKAGGIALEHKEIMIRNRTFDVLMPDYRYLREHGLSMRHVRLTREPTDYDADGIHEVWLKFESTGEEVVITFPPEGDTSQWQVVGSFPGGCVIKGEDEPELGYFPLVECKGTHWQYFPQDDDYGAAGYQLQGHEGVVVYYRPRRLGEEEPPPMGATGPQEDFDPLRSLGRLLDVNSEIKVARLPIRSWPDFSHFLSDRGVNEPIHYFLCESAFPGLPPQAVLGNGNVQRFSMGCHGGIKIEGEIRGQVLAVVVSPSGHQALVDDVLTYYAGDPQALFLKPTHVPIRNALRKTPGYEQGGSWVMPNPFTNRIVDFDPRPDRPIPPGPRWLANVGPTAPAAPQAFTHTIVDRTTDLLEMPNCGMLWLNTGTFHRSGLMSLIPSSFSVISEAGCSGRTAEIVTIDYPLGGSQSRDAMVGDYRVRAVVESEVVGRGVEVLRYRIAYRKDKASGPTPVPAPAAP